MEIRKFQQEDASSFHDLNIEWLETFFYVEPYDREVLSHPQKHILDPGGEIFFAVDDSGKILGTVALMPYDSRVYELTKMAVLPSARGNKIGHQLLQHCIDYVRNLGHDRLMLYSNTKLENAIYLYRKFGFKEVAVEENSKYERSNIKMQLDL